MNSPLATTVGAADALVKDANRPMNRLRDDRQEHYSLYTIVRRQPPAASPLAIREAHMNASNAPMHENMAARSTTGARRVFCYLR
jgi:hypothetical protein